MDDECIHGTNSEWCAICNGADRPSSSTQGYGFHGGETKQDILNDICDDCGIPRHALVLGAVFRQRYSRKRLCEVASQSVQCRRLAKRSPMPPDSLGDETAIAATPCREAVRRSRLTDFA